MLTSEEIESIRVRLNNSIKTKIRPRRIRAIRVNPTSQLLPPLFIEVGKVCRNLEAGAPPEEVLAIFESSTFLVITRSRGLNNNLPYFFSKEDVHEVMEMKQ